MPVRKPRFIMREISDVKIRQRISDGYFDATAMCEASDMDLVDYLELTSTKKFLKVLSKETELKISDLVHSKDKDGAIWIHPNVALNLSQRAKPYIAIIIPKWVFEWMKKLNEENTPSENEFRTTSGVKFEEIDPEFGSWIKKAAKFNPDKNNTEQ